jgi:hypothetical protein
MMIASAKSFEPTLMVGFVCAAAGDIAARPWAANGAETSP